MAYFGDDLSGVSLGIQNNDVILSSINKSDSSLSTLNIKASSTNITGDLSANNIYVSGNLLNSNGKQFENKITQNTDISLNNVKIHGNIEIIGNGDASFNSVNVTSLNVNGSSVTGDINGISEDTYSRYSPNISGTSVTWNSGTTENAIKFSKHLIPSANDTYDIGGTGGARWNSLHVKDIFVSGNSIFSESIKAISVGNDGSISMPAGTKIGGVNPSTVKIVLVVDNSGNLPDNVYYQIGDAYNH